MSKQIEIHFPDQLADLYSVGYLSNDINQIVAYARLLEEGREAEASQFFSERTKGLNRQATPLRDFRHAARIRDAEKGSLVLTVATTIAAAVLGGIVGAMVSAKLAEEKRVERFEISPSDKRINRLLDQYAEGTFGRGYDALQFLLERLQQLGYDVKVLSDNAYAVYEVADRTADRMVRMIRHGRNK